MAAIRKVQLKVGKATEYLMLVFRLNDTIGFMSKEEREAEKDIDE